MRQVSGIVSDALFILLVEKDAAFMRLAEDRFYNSYPCIIITAKGQPDVASRRAPWPSPFFPFASAPSRCRRRVPRMALPLLGGLSLRGCSTWAGGVGGAAAFAALLATASLEQGVRISCGKAAGRAHSLFLRKLKMELKIPVLALVDSDPYGLKILSVYMKGARPPPPICPTHFFAFLHAPTRGQITSCDCALTIHMLRWKEQEHAPRYAYITFSVPHNPVWSARFMRGFVPGRSMECVAPQGQ